MRAEPALFLLPTTRTKYCVVIPGIDGDLGGGRTHNLQLRRLTLYPIELRDRDDDSSIHTTACQAGGFLASSLVFSEQMVFNRPSLGGAGQVALVSMAQFVGVAVGCFIFASP